MKICSMHSSLENVCISACPAFLGPHIFCVPARSFLLLVVVGKLDGPVLKKLADCSYDPVSLCILPISYHPLLCIPLYQGTCTPYTYIVHIHEECLSIYNTFFGIYHIYTPSLSIDTSLAFNHLLHTLQLSINHIFSFPSQFCVLVFHPFNLSKPIIQLFHAGWIFHNFCHIKLSS